VLLKCTGNAHARSASRATVSLESLVTPWPSESRRRWPRSALRSARYGVVHAWVGQIVTFFACRPPIRPQGYLTPTQPGRVTSPTQGHPGPHWEAPQAECWLLRREPNASHRPSTGSCHRARSGSTALQVPGLKARRQALKHGPRVPPCFKTASQVRPWPPQAASRPPTRVSVGRTWVVGRITSVRLSKTFIQFKTICPTQACTKPYARWRRYAACTSKPARHMI
jgi:hypothetical protein